MNKALQSASYNLLKALIRVLYRYSCSCIELIQVVKHAYVTVCEEELIKAGEKPTTSRIAIISGLTRKDVTALRKIPAIDKMDLSPYNRGVLVAKAWHKDAAFIDAQGKPKVLPLKGDNSFETLVNRYSGDMPAPTMLLELKRIGMVEQINDTQGKRIKLRHSTFVTGGDEVVLTVLGDDVALLINSIHHNIAEPDSPYYQRKVCYDHVPESVLPEFRELANTENQQLLLRLNDWLEQHDLDSNPTLKDKHTNEPRMRVGVGVYYFQEPVDHHE